MNLNDPLETPLIDVQWSGTILNIHTIGLMLVTPFWGAFMVMDGKGLTLLVLFVLLGGMIGLSLVKKPLFRYDPDKRIFIAPDNQTLPLDQVDTIEMDARDIYFIPKSHTHEGWHLAQRCWVLSPRRVLKAHAETYGWPLKDIANPVVRFGCWIVP
ncbi:hypothetical protein [Asticcacaulis sp. YBE204]|uniref:hypothetical protein n=1 Tax=Asticcacaulis sp. YBE204 TaxID=1282363 RepID=UPI0003C3C48D|nr:hypothetical protein [Asticcacaulis sp. YBE204]ESQ80771.1 hypothetical protein AEYBE204_00175 [Asticcacaulis sp. YBE204]